MLLAVVLASCAVCGRIGFDTVAATTGSGSADAGADASPDAFAGRLTYLVSAGPNTGDPSELVTLDTATGHLTHIGTIDGSLGQLGGLAYWDANTLYATSSDYIVQITISPFSATQMAFTSAAFPALERDGTDLIALNPSGLLLRFPPSFASSTQVTFGAPIDGGDITKLSNGGWYYYSNATTTLYTFDPTSGTTTPIGASSPPGYVSALLRDDSDHLYITVESANALVAIDATTGALGASQTLCESCPTPYTLGAGDATRTP